MRRLLALAIFLLTGAVFVGAAPAMCARSLRSSSAAKAMRHARAISQGPPPEEGRARANASEAASADQDLTKVTQYTLPPALYRKAHRLGQISFWGTLIATLYSWLILLLILNWRLAPKYRDWAEKVSHSRFLQALIFAPLLLATVLMLEVLPDIGQHWVSRRYGISIQGWGSWAWDWAKQEIILIIVGTFLVWILYAIIRRSPRRWWLYFWLISLPLMIFLVFVQPVVVDPLFHNFVPLAQKDPALTAKLEQLVHHAGQNIPPSRMFWMDAGAKTTALNAYVTGIGASKRIVVWNTTIRAMDTPQIVFVVGHEMGHYVLNHIWKGMAAGAAGLLVLFYLVFRLIGPMLERWGKRPPNPLEPGLAGGPLRAPGTGPPLRHLSLTTNWNIRGVDDWASLPAILLLVSILSFIATPIGSAFSRHIEHQADQYGLEVTHGLAPDSSQVAAQSFEILGKVDLSDPAPNPLDVFLFYSHPPIPARIHFALTYDPWAHGRKPEFVK